ncbi:hypothetical protein ILUMI_26441 [Ignelater luminosus]|uniref:Chitin-binding type-2 domain-containing protein n=1 Tax=Ignelater luminosus TaxID=2038154 RepID=A0A8K0C7Z1_IGNLU|nr:hypothetical protein ILUMI_26441 [Ignelater luminosus]
MDIYTYLHNRFPPVTCTVPGPKCGDDCQTLYFCTRVGDELIPQYLDTCRGLTCNKDRCSRNPSLECAIKGIDFECRSLEGMYPDPGSCKKFHYCVPEYESDQLNRTTSACKGNFGYNPRTTYCDVPLLPGGTCSGDPIPLCRRPGDNGAIKANPTLYYICGRYLGTGILYPYLHMCANGKTYNATLFDCQ